MSPRLTARTPIRDWLADPVGGPLFTAFLAQRGTDATRLGPISGYPIGEFVTLSQGTIDQEAIDALVRDANGGELVVESEASPAASDLPVRDDLTLADIQIRDPFLLVHDGAYHLFGSTDRNIWFGPGTGFDTYRSTDLATWSGPVPAFRPPAGFWAPGKFWAPEVHAHAGRFFLFATFTGHDDHMGTAVLAANAPQGPFEPWSDGPITPAKWQCLDATLFVDAAGNPWAVFCQEWTQIHDGAMWATRLSPDLRRAEGVPVFLFNASDAAWSKPLTTVPQAADARFPIHVTDGPFLFRLGSGHLVMLWSSFGEQGYAMGVAHSASGDVTGPWTQEDAPLWAADGGHGMVVRLLDGSLALTLHQPNTSPDERAIIRRLVEHESTITLAEGASA